MPWRLIREPGDGRRASSATPPGGDSLLSGFEQRDDGNVANGDGCSSVMTCEGGTVMTFEGLGSGATVGNYYDGGSGPNYGLGFSNAGLALIDSDAGGGGDFGGELSPSTILFFQEGASTVMNVPAGFSGGFSISYSAISSPETIRLFDVLGAGRQPRGHRLSAGHPLGRR